MTEGMGIPPILPIDPTKKELPKKPGEEKKEKEEDKKDKKVPPGQDTYTPAQDRPEEKE